MKFIKYDQKKCKVLDENKEYYLIEYEGGWCFSDANYSQVRDILLRDKLWSNKLKKGKCYWIAHKGNCEILFLNELELE